MGESYSYLFERSKNMEIFTLLVTLEDILERSKKIEKNLQELSDENIINLTLKSNDKI